MNSPFPGMDPYLEHPALWPDVHNRLIAAMADAISPAVAPHYYVGLERRAYLFLPDDMVFVGRPDIAAVKDGEKEGVRESAGAMAPAAAVANDVMGEGIMDIEVPMSDEVFENYLEIHEVKTGKLVTVLELLSPSNKVQQEGREQYVRKRLHILQSFTNLVEIDLLRMGEPMEVIGRPVQSDYRVLISRGWQRPRAQLYAFNLRQPIPVFPIPLLREDSEPTLDLNTILHDLYQRARFDLRLDYNEPPVPSLGEHDADWGRTLLTQTS